jgi:hypothetical protein
MPQDNCGAKTCQFLRAIEARLRRVNRHITVILVVRSVTAPPAPFLSATSPSTRYSESPSIWSRGSTPTSLSSYSPGIIVIPGEYDDNDVGVDPRLQILGDSEYLVEGLVADLQT